jgi:hypothetical protein
MRAIKYHSEQLKNLFYKKKIVTIKDIMDGLGVYVKRTAFRKLRQYNYCSSYSHAGKYYALNEIINYNKYGIWQINDVLFSIKGTLVNTLQNLIETSDSGYTALELIKIVKVRVQDALYKLYMDKRIYRKEINCVYNYFSKNNYKEQSAKRKEIIIDNETGINHINIQINISETRKYLQIFLSTLNEKQRRLYVGFESMKIGYGGDKKISEITGVNVKTIAAGRKELINNNINSERIRSEGAGSHSLKKKHKSSLNLKN